MFKRSSGQELEDEGPKNMLIASSIPRLMWSGAPSHSKSRSAAVCWRVSCSCWTEPVCRIKLLSAQKAQEEGQRFSHGDGGGAAGMWHVALNAHWGQIHFRGKSYHGNEFFLLFLTNRNTSQSINQSNFIDTAFFSKKEMQHKVLHKYKKEWNLRI